MLACKRYDLFLLSCECAAFDSMNMFGADLFAFVACLTTANCDFNFGRLHIVAANHNTAEAGTHDGQRFALELEKVPGYANASDSFLHSSAGAGLSQ